MARIVTAEGVIETNAASVCDPHWSPLAYRPELRVTSREEAAPTHPGACDCQGQTGPCGHPQWEDPIRQHAWGWSVPVEEKGYTKTVFCRGRRGYSSLHRHRHLSNRFLVKTGCLDIEVIDRISGEREWARVEAGKSFFVLPGEWHRLIVVEPGYFWEVYSKPGTDHPVNWDDIERLDEGSSEDYQP